MKRGLFVFVVLAFFLLPCAAQQPAAVLVASWEEGARGERAIEPNVFPLQDRPQRTAARGERAIEPKAVSLGANTMARDLESAVLAHINRERQRLGLPPLALDETLALIARAHAAEMARAGVLSHVGADGASTVERARLYGLRGWRALGENIAFNQGFDDPAGFAVERWMQSPKHRANITNALFTHTGIGVVRTPDGRVFFTQLFLAR